MIAVSFGLVPGAPGPTWGDNFSTDSGRAEYIRKAYAIVWGSEIPPDTFSRIYGSGYKSTASIDKEINKYPPEGSGSRNYQQTQAARQQAQVDRATDAIRQQAGVQLQVAAQQQSALESALETAKKNAWYIGGGVALVAGAVFLFTRKKRGN